MQDGLVGKGTSASADYKTVDSTTGQICSLREGQPEFYVMSWYRRKSQHSKGYI